MKWIYWIIFIILFFGVFKVLNENSSYDELLTPKQILGNENSNIKIEVFEDIECPVCNIFHPVLKQIEAEFDVSIKYFHFPLTQLHKNAFKAAEAAECANDQDKFWEYVDLAHKNNENLLINDLREYAKQVNLDINKFEACLISNSKKNIIKQDIREGLKRNVQGTPTVFINGKELSDWRYDSFKEALIKHD